MLVTFFSCEHHRNATGVGMHKISRNPNLAKCGGEAQHLERVGIWSPPGLLNVQSSTTRGKTPRIGVFLVSLGHLQPKLWAKEGLGVKLPV
jgi:hypothetical protein